MWNQTDFKYGNLINIKDIGVCKVTGVLPHRTYYTPMMSGHFSDFLYSLHVYIKPIELTDAILYLAGFTRQNGYPDFFLEGFGLVYEYSDGGYGWSYNDGLSIPLKYLHQLQNLHFHIKQKELDIEKIFLMLKKTII